MNNLNNDINYKEQEKELKKLGRSIQLSHDEKQAIKNHVLAVPVKVEQAGTFSNAIANFFFRNKFEVAAVSVFILLGGIPFTYATQISRPGDLLHNLELRVFEPLEEVFTFSPESKVEFAIERVEERLDEVLELQDNSITAEQANVAWENVDEHVDELIVSINSMPNQEQELDNLVTVLGLLGAYEELDQAQYNSTDIYNLITEVDTDLTEHAAKYADSQSEADLIDAVEEYIDETELLLGSDSDPEVKAIQLALDSAEANLEAGDLDQALLQAVEAQIEALAYSHGQD